MFLMSEVPHATCYPSPIHRDRCPAVMSVKASSPKPPCSAPIPPTNPHATTKWTDFRPEIYLDRPADSSSLSR